MSTLAVPQVNETKVLSLIGGGHLLSHVFVMILPPLFPLLKDELNVSYAGLGLILGSFSLVATISQMPMGFLVDRIGGRYLLAAALIVQGIAAVVAALAGSYWIMVAMFGLAGLAGTVFHPADYAILSASITRPRLGRAFSVHSLSGNIGSAVTPPVMVALTALWSWQSAMTAAGLLSISVGALVAWQRRALTEEPISAAVRAAPQREKLSQGVALLASTPILLAFVFCLLSSVSYSAIYSFVVVAVVEIDQTPLAAANSVLTAFLASSAVGIFAATFLIDRVARPAWISVVSFAAAAVIMLLVGSVPLSLLMLLLALGACGFCFGVVQPARDLLVQQATPVGSTGKVFGFMSMGFSVGGTVTPIVFGWILDQGGAHWIFWLAAVFLLLSIFAIGGFSRSAATSRG